MRYAVPVARTTPIANHCASLTSAVHWAVPASATSVCGFPPSAPRNSSTPSGGTGRQRAPAGTWTSSSRCSGTTIRSPCACGPATTGISTSRRRSSRMDSAFMRITSRSSLELGVLLAAQAVRPAGGGDRIGEPPGDPQPVPASVPVALHGSVGGQQKPARAAPQVVQLQDGAGVAGVGCGGHEFEPGPVDVRVPAQPLHRASSYLDVAFGGDPLDGRVENRPRGYRCAPPRVTARPVPVPDGGSGRVVYRGLGTVYDRRPLGYYTVPVVRPPPSARPGENTPLVEVVTLLGGVPGDSEPAVDVVVPDPVRLVLPVPAQPRVADREPHRRPYTVHNGQFEHVVYADLQQVPQVRRGVRWTGSHEAPPFRLPQRPPDARVQRASQPVY